MDKEYIDKSEAYRLIKHEAETHELPASKEAYERAARIISMMKPCKIAEMISMNDKPHWTDTEETVWDAKSKDDGHELEISIVTAKCSECERWAEQVNQFPPRMHYEYCPHCGKKMR